jgi:hypothetical protein
MKQNRTRRQQRVDLPQATANPLSHPSHKVTTSKLQEELWQR